jgi:hypothetical protein
VAGGIIKEEEEEEENNLSELTKNYQNFYPKKCH